MNTANVINPNLLTFRQLKNLVGKTGGMKLPKAPDLEDSKEDILFVDVNGDETITVYRNGFYTFQHGERKTVFAVDRIKTIEYRFDDNSSTVINECDFLDNPCLVPLYITGDTRLEHNIDRIDGYWQKFALENDGSDWSVFDESTDPEAVYLAAEQKEKLREAIKSLTTRQQAIIKLHYFDGMSSKKIADQYHISQRAVNKTLRLCEELLKKYFDEN